MARNTVETVQEVTHSKNFEKVKNDGLGCKINIATASYDSSAAKIKEVYGEKPEANYFDFSDAIVQGTCDNIKKHMHIFGVENKA